MPNNITMGLDISQLRGEADKLLQIINQQGEAFQDLAVKMVAANEAGDRIKATFVAVADSGQKVEIQVGKSNTSLRVLSRSFTDSTVAAKGLIVGINDAGEAIGDLGLRLASIAGRQVFRRLVSDLVTDFKAGVAEAQNFSIEIARLEGIQKGPAGATAAWSKNLQVLANQFGNSETDVAKAAYVALQSQLLKAGDSTDLLATSLKFAKVANLDASESTKLLTTTLNAFRLPVTDADRVAGIYFKTLQNGVVAPQELATQFGRLASTAAGTGVNLEEIAAAVDVLTTRGLKFADATNLVNNLLLAGAKPSKELKQLFIDLGLGSAEAVIKGQGFGGFLKVLDKEAQNGNERLGELLPTLRNFRAELNLSGDAFKDFNEKLADISKGGVGALDNAFMTQVGSTGQQIKDEFERVKNYFAQDFGPAVIKILATVGAAAESIHKVFNIVNGGVSDLQATAIEQDAILQEKRRGLIERGNFEQTDYELKLVQNYKNSTDEKYRILLDFAGKTIALNDSIRKQTVKNLEAEKEAIKSSGGEFINYLGKNLQQVKQVASEAGQIIKQSLKISEDLPKKNEDALFQLKLKYASPGGIDSGGNHVIDQQGDLIALRIRQVNQRIADEEEKGSKQNIDEVRKYFDEREKLIIQKFEHETTIRKQQFEQDAKTGQISPTSFDDNGRPRYQFIVNTRDVERDINKLTKERLDYEASIRDIQAQRQKEAENAALAETTRIKRIQELLSKAASFSIFDKEGQIKKEFSKDPQAAANDFQKITDDLSKNLRPNEGGIGVLNDLIKQKVSIAGQAAIEIKNIQLKVDSEALLQQKTNAEKSAKQLETSLLESRDKINKILSDTGKNEVPVLEQLAKPNRTTSGLDIFNNNKVYNQESDQIAKSQTAREYLSELIQSYKALSDEFKLIQNPTSEQISKFEELRIKIRDVATAAAQLRTGQEDLSKVFISGKNIQEAIDKFGEKTFDAFSTSKENISIVAQFEKVRQKLSEVTSAADNLPKTFEATTISSKNLGDKISNEMNLAGKTIKDVTLELIRLQTEVNKIKEDTASLTKSTSNPTIPTLPPALPGSGVPDVPGQFFGGSVKYFDAGGPVTWRARGSDQHPAMLGGDEFVMTGQATKQWYPLLQAINSSAGRSNGGSVHNTQIGDINVNLTGSSVPEQNAKNIAKALRRELRRGTVTLG